jgi:hypothetical protein
VVNLDAVCGRLAEMMEDLEKSRLCSPRDLLRAALCIEHVAMCDLFTPEEEAAIIADPRVAARLASCQNVFCALETAIEGGMAEVARLGGAAVIWGDDNVSQHYIARYEYLAGREIELAGIRRDDHALFIGSGPLPITAFEYVRQCGCSVDCVDFVPEAIECSRRIAERLGLAGRVRCFQTRGELHDPSDYDVILVGVLASPKQEIVDHLDARVKEGCRVICRTTYGLRQLIYRHASYDDRLLRRLSRGGCSVARGERVISAELLTASVQ